MYNHTGLQGRLTADPELRYTQQGTAITSFTLASDTGRKTKDGKKITNFIECVAWRAQAEFVCKYLSKGRLILETLGNRELTASEITEELVAAGRIPYFNRNYVAPRLTELKEIGILTTVGRRKATRSDATEAVWARAEPSGPTGQTAAAYADNPTEAEQMTLGSAT